MSIPPRLIPRKKRSYLISIGIDTGTNTGIGIWHHPGKSLTYVNSMPVHQAFDLVRSYTKTYDIENVFVRFEDARKVKYNTSEEKKQGAGYVKAHSQIWEAFLTELGVDFEGVRPNKAITKLSSELFKKITGWQSQTNQHGRDAAMLVYKS